MKHKSVENPYGAARVKSSLIHFIFGKFTSAIIGISLILLLVRSLPVKEYGIYIVLVAMLEVAQLASNFGLFAMAQRYVPELRLKHEGEALHRLLLQLSKYRLITLIFVAGLIGLFTPYLSSLINLLGYEVIFITYGLVIVAEGYARYTDMLFDSLLMQGHSQTSILLRNGLRLLGLIVLNQSTELVTLQDWVVVELIASLIGASVSAWMLFSHSNKLRKTTPGTQVESISRKRCFDYSFPSYLAQIVGLAYGPEITKMIITKSIGLAQVGAFGFAASISATLQRYLPVFLLLGLVRPLFVAAGHAENKNERLSLLMNIVLKLNLFLLFPMIAFIQLSGNQFSIFLSSGKFPESGNYLLIFSILLVFQAWHAVLGLVTIAIEDGTSGFKGTLFALLGLLGGIWLLPAFGVYSLCVGLVVSEICWCGYVMLALRTKSLSLSINWSGTFKMMLFSVVGYFTALALNQLMKVSTITLMTVDMLVIASVFLFLCYCMKTFNDEERSMINKILPKPIFVW